MIMADFIFSLIYRFFRRVFKSLFYMYAPGVLTLGFAIIWIPILHNETIWPVPVFYVFIGIIMCRYIK